MNGRQFARFLARDLHCPCGCVGYEDTLVPQHRINRGMGGSQLLDYPANILVLCSRANGLIESDPACATRARIYGWKLRPWENPLEQPFYDVATSSWYLLDNHFNRTITTEVAA